MKLGNSINSSKLKLGTLRKGLIAHYPLDKLHNYGNTVLDLGSNKYNGTITVGASTGFVNDWKGTLNGAYDFDGSVTKINTGTNWFNGLYPVSISGWIYLDSITGSPRIIDNIIYKYKN